MKVAVLFDLSDPSTGGAFTFNKTIYDGLLSFQGKTQIEFLKVHSVKNSLGLLPDIALPGPFRQKIFFMRSLVRQIFSRRFIRSGVSIQICRSTALYSALKDKGVEFVWAVQPIGFPLSIPYMTTSWDIAHRITPYFSEVSGNGDLYKKRDETARQVFNRAFRIIVGTQRGAEEIGLAYGVNSERFSVQAFPVKEVRNLGGLERIKNRFVYPANFWPHKNHLILVEALRLAQDQYGEKIELLLTGVDKGALKFLQLRINELSLQENVTLAGFVTEESLARVFQTSNALVFPSLIGPDNLPPLEAMSHGARIIVADIPGAREQFQEFAEYFNPNDKFELANIMLKSLADFGKTEDDKISKNDFLKIHSVENYIAGIIKEIELNSMVLRNIQG